jgi:hypothetical protein
MRHARTLPENPPPLALLGGRFKVRSGHAKHSLFWCAFINGKQSSLESHTTAKTHLDSQCGNKIEPREYLVREYWARSLSADYCVGK